MKKARNGIYYVLSAIRLVQQPGWLSNKSCIFSGKNPAKMQFLKEVVQKLKFLNKSIIVFSIITALIIIYILMPRGKPVEILETDELFSVIKDGDIICRLGDRLWSLFFKDISITDKRFSHMGIVRINEGNITVINAEGNTGHGRDFVSEITIEEFLNIARAVGVYRIKNINGNVISDMAMEYLGVPFDWQFDMSDESKLYCTELLYVILKRIMPELELRTAYVKELETEVITLDAVSNSDYFSEVYYTCR